MKKPITLALAGTLERLLFSPKGKLEGLLLTSKGQRLQITMEPGVLDAAALAKAIGKRIEIQGTADVSPKVQRGAHPVYILETLLKVGGKTASMTNSDQGSTTVKGMVAALHYARHGEPNGVILKSGEFIHLRPHGMKQCRLSIGSSVSVQGERRTTIIGTPLIEAHRVNQYTIE